MLAAAGTGSASIRVHRTNAAHRELSRAQASAVAVAIGLRRGDIPSLTQGFSPPPGAVKAQFALQTGCVGGPRPKLVYAIQASPIFTSKDQTSLTINANTAIWPSASLVAKDIAATKSTRGLQCYEAGLKNALSQSTNANLTGSVSLLPSPVSGADTSVAFRVTLTENSVPLVIADFVVFGWGQAEVTYSGLAATTFAPPSASIERRISVILVGRARSAIG
jgi:hypothetical protein